MCIIGSRQKSLYATLGQHVRLEASIGVSFGLDMTAVLAAGASLFLMTQEAIMGIVNASVWCGAAFLRRTVVVMLQSRREMQ